ncbi:MAG: hypothetical protein RLY93_13115 [Sumerlaeia bacterium]
MDYDDKLKRQRISALMREAATLFSGKNPPDLDPALPKMHRAVRLAEELDDKRPLLICRANLAQMNAVCGRAGDALNQIDRAINIATDDPHLPVAVRNFAFMKFLDIALLLRAENKRALIYARALMQSAVEEEEDYNRFLLSVYELARVCHDLSKSPDWALALVSWLLDTAPHSHPVWQQARRYSEKIVRGFPRDLSHAWQSEIEANRDILISEASGEFLPFFAMDAPRPW